MGVVRGRAIHDDTSRPDEDDQVEVVDRALLRGRRISPSSSSNWKGMIQIRNLQRQTVYED